MTASCLVSPSAVLAQSGNDGCAPTPYAVAEGESVFTIAEKHYGDPEQWTLIYYANEDKLKASVFQVSAGDVLMIPCAPGSAQANATPLLRDEAEINLLTGSGFSPFTDQDWPGSGMVTELVHAVMESTPDPLTYSLTWNDTWADHLADLDAKRFDMGFPWYQPNCAQTPNEERCKNFHFSDPLVEVLILLFVNEGSQFTFESDADIVGKRLCRPAGYFTHDLERPDRQWLSRGLVSLIQPDTPQDCFAALQAGDVDAVTVNVFLGATTIEGMGLRGKVVPLDRPLSSESLHVIISKKHWRGTTHLYRFNAGLAVLKDSDRYAQIVSKHLGIFWDKIKIN
ncbi:transporter substrate-binding domain-containing protein [Thalassococcus lentus]|uniref:Transporter substrate-binding domain-containing protein n=1 Tax=Thalassococcus lentus TaxID=1210524 RepID=A0ABT4XY21_9RHOB|nr:transporter substrate-binding domain-containing protein [Thalassococcus lentus]MDA7426777.1 transporter substrate-binding domain-containing protein [Thalassococcus lentus]